MLSFAALAACEEHLVVYASWRLQRRLACKPRFLGASSTHIQRGYAWADSSSRWLSFLRWPRSAVPFDIAAVWINPSSFQAQLSPGSVTNHPKCLARMNATHATCVSCNKLRGFCSWSSPSQPSLSLQSSVWKLRNGCAKDGHRLKGVRESAPA